MEFRALHTTSLTEDIAQNLERLLVSLPGIQRFTIIVEKQEFYVMFDERQLGLKTLVGEMAKVGCPLRNINAVLVMDQPMPDGERSPRF